MPLFFFIKFSKVLILTPKGRTIAGSFYAKYVLSQVVDHYKKVRPRTGVRGIKLFHDNAPAHNSKVAKSKHAEYGIEVLPHPPYSPDLALCDFWLFQKLKDHLRGNRFRDRSDLRTSIFQYLKHLPQEMYIEAFYSWMARLQKCIN